ncbi:ATP-dependent nuclease [Bacillus pumilus]|uniref:ATP-dependent nuclease n=1 Tax=Bacillus pumilus TaxID=1408 RepID=UPI0030004C43
MRTARASDHWRNLYEKPFKFKISKVTYDRLKGFGSGGIEFMGGITAICGGNGVGKSTLLNAISSVLTSERLLNQKSINLKLEGSELLGEFIDSGQPITRKVNISSNTIEADPEIIDVESVWIDSAIHAPKLIDIFSDMPNLNELLEPEDPKILNESENSLISYIVGKEYLKCEIYELDLEHYGIVPYFKVLCNGVEYGSEAMGFGEISVHYLLWNLQRISKNSVVLMEEPETYLAPRSQEALLDVIAKIAVEKKLWVILTTHSPNIIKNIPFEHIRILNRIDETVEISIPTTSLEPLYSLGLNPQKLGVILVEDRCAREFTKCWLGRFDPNIVQQYDVVDIGSKEKILQEVRIFPKIGSWFKLFGIFDGNERGRIEAGKYKWNFSYLPGEVAPELLLKRIAKSMRNELAQISGRDLTRINAALHSLDGRDHHDWIEEFPRQIGVGYEQLIAFLFEISMAKEDYLGIHQDAYYEFLTEFERRIER